MKKTTILKSTLLVTLLAIFSVISAQQTAEKYVVETDYLLYMPDGYNAADTIAKWPLMLFLHGAGETGNDIEKVKVHGPAKLIEQGKKFPFIVVSPQTRQYGWRNEQLIGLLTDLITKYNVDPERIYLTGISMGGFGTWSLAAAYPEMFAAIIPICGGGDPSTAFKLRNMPIWCFHGAMDDVVPLNRSQQMVDAVKKYNQDVQFTIYPEAMHDSWTETYNNDAIYEWLLQHKQFEYEEIAVSPTILSEYAGSYADRDGNVLNIIFEDDKIYLQMEGMGSFRPQLRPASDTEFFVDEKIQHSCKFERNSDGKVSGAYFYSNKEAYFEKI